MKHFVTIHCCIVMTLCAFSPQLSLASWSLRPQVGIGFTNNANYESENLDPDSFWWVRSSNTYLSDKEIWSLWLNYRDYFRQNQNDAVTYRFGHTLEINHRSLGAFDWDLGMGGQQYVNENPGTTEQSFNYIYLDTSASKTKVLKPNVEITFGPLYQLTSFPSLGGRVDHTLLLSSVLEWQITPIQKLIPNLDLGYVISNQNLYSKHFLEIGAECQIENDPTLKYIFHFMSRYSTYPNRLLTDTTAVTTRSGRVRTTSRAEIESQTFYQIQATAAKLLGSAELRASLALNQNTALSGIEDYKEMQILGAVTVPIGLP